MLRFTKRLTLLVLLGVSTPAALAQAQTVGGALNDAQGRAGDLFARDRAVSVRDRPRPDYEALGVPAGAFTAYPRIQMDAQYSDNVFAVSTGEESDFIVRIKPEVSLESGWSRHALGAYARADIGRYQDFDGENYEDWGVGAAGRLDITRAANIAAGFDYAELTEPRSSSNTAATAVEPVQYSLTQGNIVGTRVSGRLKLSARADVREFDYDDGRTLGGVVIDQDNRDRTITSGTARADVALSPATAIFVQVTGNERDYDTATSLLLPARDSSGYEVLAGTNFEVGAVARGEFAVGYISQEFDSAVYDTIDGFGARAQLEWFPTELTTLTATASRTIEDAGIAGSGGYLSTAGGVSVDHELMRNVLLGAGLTFSRDEYEGIDREDERFSASAGATYLINRVVGVSLTASHLEQNSSGIDDGADFNVNSLTLSLVAQF